ncbi:hypothetical protein [Kitasatospora sp. NPDC054795]
MDERMLTKGVEARYRKGHGKAPVVITTLEGVDALVDDLLDGEDDCCTLAEVYSQDREPHPSGFPDHQLMVGADRSLGLGPRPAARACGFVCGRVVPKPCSDVR